MSSLRNRFIVACVAVCLISFASAQTAQSWKLLHPPGALFSVSIPGTPTPQKQTITDPVAGKLNLTTYFLVSGKYFYAAQDMLADTKIPSSEYASTLEGVQRGFLRTSGTTLVSAQPFTYKGYTAREMMFKKDTKLVRGLTMMVGNHCISFFATTEGAQIKSAGITKFFDSIKINGK